MRAQLLYKQFEILKLTAGQSFCSIFKWKWCWFCVRVWVYLVSRYSLLIYSVSWR